MGMEMGMKKVMGMGMVKVIEKAVVMGMEMMVMGMRWGWRWVVGLRGWR